MLEDIRVWLADHGDRRSQYQSHFSKRWLGRSPSYYSYLVATGAQPSREVLFDLALRLRDHSVSMPSTDDGGSETLMAFARDILRWARTGQRPFGKLDLRRRQGGAIAVTP
jgi:hypothetical protein